MIDHSKITFIRHTHGNPEVDALYEEGITYLFDHGLTINSKTRPTDQYDEAIIAKYNDDIMGGTFWTNKSVPKHNHLFINLTYTLPKYRRYGLYVLLNKHLDILMIERNIEGCISWQSKGNTDMDRVRGSVGYVPVMTLYRRAVNK